MPNFSFTTSARIQDEISTSDKSIEITDSIEDNYHMLVDTLGSVNHKPIHQVHNLSHVPDKEENLNFMSDQEKEIRELEAHAKEELERNRGVYGV